MNSYIIFFLRNRGSEKERVAEEMPISEVRKCSRLLTPINSLIDQLHYCVVGTWLCLKYCLEKILNVEGVNYLKTAKLRMKYLFLRGAIDISVYLKKSSVHAPYCVQFWWHDLIRK